MDNISKYRHRNDLIRKVERFILKIITFIIIPACFIMAIIYPNHKFMDSLPILFSLAGLIQLEVAGLFEYVDYLGNELEKVYEESGRVPSSITRGIFEFYNPEPTLKAWINNNLYLNKRTGFYFILIGGVIQLIGIWWF